MKGPCEEDQWWVLNDAQDAGVCEVKPKDCPSDGQHVYWSPPSTDNSIVPQKQCNKLGDKCPAPEGGTVKRGPSLFQVTCADFQQGGSGIFGLVPVTRTKKSCTKGNPKCI